ncbi:MAG: ABC transporter ATP-binding protein [Chloroflexi bacterium]|nr:ABC transporter ATP-binding protein [Chloroflexota bacterium]
MISCRQLVKAYQVGGHEVVALRGIDFEMAQGEMVAIIGPSGAGKSTLLNLLGGLDRPTAGQLTVAGQNLLDLKGRRLDDYRLRQVGFIWQQMDRNLMPHRTAFHNVTLPLLLAGVPALERRRRARALLETVGLTDDQARQRPAELSGGQQQRVAVAVALANEPVLLLADEPTGSLDRASAMQVMELITGLRREIGLTVLMVTHDMEIAASADRVLTLRDGALGQDLTQSDEASRPTLDGEGRLRLPEPARVQLAGTAGIAVEVRPEGVLLRPESPEDGSADALLLDMLPQDAPPKHPRRWSWRGRRRPA